MPLELTTRYRKLHRRAGVTGDFNPINNTHPAFMENPRRQKGLCPGLYQRSKFGFSVRIHLNVQLGQSGKGCDSRHSVLVPFHMGEVHPYREKCREATNGPN
jgi:hypothetical protein